MFAIDVEFLRGIYEGGGRSDDQPPEWPPHPARLVNALVASADLGDEAHLEALRWLERQPAPSIVASEAQQCGGRASYVPTNLIDSKNAGYGDLPGRKALGPRSWRALSPAVPLISIEWPDAAPDGALDALGDIVGSLPYLGRSTSPVVASVRTAQVLDAGESERRRWVPATDDDVVGPLVDVAAPGYVDGLLDAFVGDRLPWTVPRRVVAYVAERTEVRPAEVAESPYGEMIVLGFGDGRRIGVGHSLLVASRLREAIESHLDGGPLVLRGLPPKHLRSEAERELTAPSHQVAIAGLPFVGGSHADGQLRGVAVMLPRTIEADDRRAVLRGLAETVNRGLELGRLGRVDLDPAVPTLQTLQIARWVGPSRWWTTVLPTSANRHVRRADAAWRVRQVHDACAHLGLPDPVDVVVSRGPIVAGSARLSERQRLRHPGTRREKVTESFHAHVDFGVPVLGPIVLGGLRRYGLGLMLPVGPRPDPGLAESVDPDLADTERDRLGDDTDRGGP